MKKIRICFLIDDDLDDQEFFSIALKKVDEHIELHAARDCIEGFERLKENKTHPPEFIFLDINMPRMNGVQCLPEIKKLRHLKDSKVIMYTTSSSEALQQTTKQLGAHDFLVKPARLNLLVDDLSRILEKS